MNIWKRIRQLSLKQLWKLTLVFIKHPLFILPTLQATKQTFEICNTLYGGAHHKSNKANAFRHAVWNVLICKRVYKSSRNKQKSVFWTQKITDVYEKVTNNNTLDEAMDLHNNAIGRIWFFNTLETEQKTIIAALKQKTEQAVKVTSIEQINDNPVHLVYLVEQ